MIGKPALDDLVLAELQHLVEPAGQDSHLAAEPIDNYHLVVELARRAAVVALFVDKEPLADKMIESTVGTGVVESHY